MARQTTRKRKRTLSQQQAAWALLAPFLATYCAFLVYPFFKGVWISLHDWNLLAVAMNPAAAKWVGLHNYVHMLWGRNITWGPLSHPLAQLLALAVLAGGFGLHRAGRLSGRSAIPIAIAALLIFLLLGFTPGEGGRWFDRRFWPTVGNTVLFVALAAPGTTVAALLLAAALNRETRMMALFRTLFFLSQVLSVTVVTLIWQIMFSPTQGLIDNVIRVFGGSPVSWLTDPHFAMLAIVVTTIWWSLGIAMILFLAGMQDINREIYEAAALDNARGWKSFWFITLPNLKRTITLVVVLQIILHFQVFGQSHLMTQGGPDDRTQVLVRYIYQSAFRDSEIGRASAMAVFLFAIMSVFAVIQFLIGREKSE